MKWFSAVIVGLISATLTGAAGNFLYSDWTLFYFVAVTALALSWFPLVTIVRRIGSLTLRGFVIGGFVGFFGPLVLQLLL